MRNGLYRALSVLLCTVVLTHAQFIEVRAPNGGEVFRWGDTMRISWDAEDIPQVVVELSVDDGEDWVGVFQEGISPHSPGWLDTFWIVQPFLLVAGDTVYTASGSCRVRIFNYVGGYPADLSDSLFTIIDSTSAPPSPPPDDGDADGCGCGSGTGSALLVPVGFRVARRFRRKKTRHAAGA